MGFARWDFPRFPRATTTMPSRTAHWLANDHGGAEVSDFVLRQAGAHEGNDIYSLRGHGRLWDHLLLPLQREGRQTHANLFVMQGGGFEVQDSPLPAPHLRHVLAPCRPAC